MPELSELDRFLLRGEQKANRIQALAEWHGRVFVETGIELPFDPGQDYVDLDVHTRYNAEEQRYEHDSDAERERLGKVYNAVEKLGGVFTKDYTNFDFELEVILPDTDDRHAYGNAPVTVTYTVDRSAVCERVVTGYVDVPERVTPAHRRETVEWKCSDTSLIRLGKQVAAKK